MSSITALERIHLEKLLEMRGGYVLNFSDFTYGDFFSKYDIGIHDDPYLKNGTSKAKKMRAFWELESDSVVAIVLSELLGIYEKNCENYGQDKDIELLEKCKTIVERLKSNEQSIGVRDLGGGFKTNDGLFELPKSETNRVNQSVKPKVFISYSWDSEEFKNQIKFLFGDELEKHGIHVIADFKIEQNRLGGDLKQFMRNGIENADRVIMVCTERYVAKLENQLGGAGYEGYLIDSEIYKDLKGIKFIPIIMNNPKNKLPRFLNKEINYLDMNDSQNNEDNMNKLVNDILLDFKNIIPF